MQYPIQKNKLKKPTINQLSTQSDTCVRNNCISFIRLSNDAKVNIKFRIQLVYILIATSEIAEVNNENNRCNLIKAVAFIRKTSLKLRKSSFSVKSDLKITLVFHLALVNLEFWCRRQQQNSLDNGECTASPKFQIHRLGVI